MENQAEFSETEPLDNVADNLQRDMPLVRTEFAEKSELMELNSEELALQQVIDSPAPIAMLRGLQEAGVETLNLEGISAGTAAQRVQGILSRGYETFQDNDLPMPDLNVYYDAQTLSQETGQSMSEALSDIELARSLQIEGSSLKPQEVGLRMEYGDDTTVATDGNHGQIEGLEATDYTNIQVRLLARPLDGVIAVGDLNNHAFIEITDMSSGEVRYASLFPETHYKDVTIDLPFTDNDPTITVPDYVQALPATSEVSANSDGVRTDAFELQSFTFKGDFDAINARVDKFNEFITGEEIPYFGVRQNSNTYAGDVYELVTGEEPENNVSWRNTPGLDGDLTNYEKTEEFGAYFD